MPLAKQYGPSYIMFIAPCAAGTTAGLGLPYEVRGGRQGPGSAG